MKSKLLVMEIAIDSDGGTSQGTRPEKANFNAAFFANIISRKVSS